MIDQAKGARMSAKATSAANGVAADVQEQLFAALRQGQDVVVKAVESWASAVGKLPTPPLSVPFSEEIPSPEEVLETSFQFAQKLLDAQHSFARDIVRAAAPAIPSAPVSAK
jgi:hypothetical protein